MSTFEERQAVSVHVTNFPELIVRTEEHEPEHFSFTTVTLQPGQAPGPQTILAHDPLRKKAWIVSNDAPIVLCDSSAQAVSPGNQVATFPAPDGGFWPQNMVLPLEGTGQVWAACQVATRVTVVVNRRADK